MSSLKSEAGLFYKTQTLCYKLDLTKTQGFGGLGPLLIVTYLINFLIFNSILE